jgi:oligopeptidase B
MRKTLVGLLVLGVALLCVSVATAELDPAVATPPVAKKVPRTEVLHGETRLDNYFWLREKKNPEVTAYLKAENTYTDAVMKPTTALQAALYKEILGRIKQTDLSVPYRLGEFYYYSRTEKGKQYPIHCRKRGSLEGKEEVTLDLNDLARGHKFLNMAMSTVSDDGNLLAYATDVSGFREYTLYVKDLRSGKLLPDRVARVSGVVWAADNKTLFYVTEDHAKRAYRLYRHVLGEKDDKLVYEEKDELYRIMARRSRDRAYVFLTSASSTTTEVRALKADRPTEEFRVVLPREVGHKYQVNHRDGLFYLLTNKDAKNFRLVTAPAKDPRPSNWKELVPHRKDVLLERLELFADHAVLSERANALPRLHVLDLAGGKDHVIDLPEPVYALFPQMNPEFNTTAYRFNYTSLVTPQTVIEYDLKARTRKVLKKMEVRGGYDPANYVSERIYAEAKDGTRIPVSLVYRKGFRKDGRSPLLLYGYGSYGASLGVGFNPSRLTLLDRGIVFAMAHVRGGKEMGEVWHDQGKMLNKRNTFTDFIAVADHLVAQKYTAHERMAIEGGSAGGLLVGAVLNLRPDVCKVAVLHVPFVDVINSMLDESLPLTVGEFLEWGNPKVKKEYDYMKTYCPYTNLGARAYPSMLVRTSLNDSQVMYWEPAKYVAKLRTLKTDRNPLLLRTNMAGGHGGSSGRYDALKEQAFTYAFVLTELGVAMLGRGLGGGDRASVRRRRRLRLWGPP